MTTSLSPRGGQAGSPGSESRNKPQRQWKEEALCQVLLLAGGCWFPWQRDAEAAGGGAWLRWGGPGRSRQIPSRCSQRWDFQGSTWNPAVKPSCLVKASTALLGNARNLLRQHTRGCLSGRSQKRKNRDDVSVFSRAYTKFVTAQKYLGGTSRLQGDRGSRLVGTCYWLIRDSYKVALTPPPHVSCQEQAR